MRELHAWENGHHVGVFSEDDEERISFAYDANEGLPTQSEPAQNRRMERPGTA